MEEEETHTETLICFFRYSPYFPSSPPLPAPSPPVSSRAPCKRPARCLLSPLSFFFCHHFPSPSCLSSSSRSLARAARIPSTATSLAGRSSFSPSNNSLFLLQCSSSLHLTAPTPHYSPPALNHRARAHKRGFLFIRVLLPRVLSSLLSFRSLALPVVSNFAKGWRNENARLGLRARRRVFFLPPPSPFPSAPFPFFYAAFFFASFLACCEPVLTISLAAVPRDREKY